MAIQQADGHPHSGKKIEFPKISLIFKCANGENFHAHRIVLTVVMPLLDLGHNALRPGASRHGLVEVKLATVPGMLVTIPLRLTIDSIVIFFRLMQKLLEFVYSGTAQVDDTALIPAVALADKVGSTAFVECSVSQIIDKYVFSLTICHNIFPV